MALPVANTLSVYCVKPIRGNEDTNTLKDFKVAGLKMLADAFKRENPNAIINPGTNYFPINWKTHFNHWIISPSQARDLLDRPAMREPSKFLDKLIERSKKGVSTTYDPSFRDLAVELAKPQSMERHNRTLFEYHDKFFSSKLEPAVTVRYDQLRDDILLLFQDAAFTKGAPLEAKNRMIALFNTERSHFIENIHDVYVEKSLCVSLQGIVAADPKLFEMLDKEQIPATANSDELTDMFQERILNPKESAIALKVVTNLSPLSSAQTISTTNNNNNSGSNKRDYTSSSGPNSGKPGKVPRQDRQQTASSTVGSTTTQQTKPAVVKTGLKNCDFCRTKFPNSISCTWHNHEYCFRDPKSKSYDSLKASVPPTK